jgi:trehalose 6-phosphate phosphatase
MSELASYAATMRQRERLLASLRADPGRTGVFTDFDGTLSRIVDRPEDAEPVEGAEEVLEALAERFGLAAVVSGRSLEDLKTRIRPKGAVLAGAYGRERSDRPMRRPTEGWETVAIAANATARTIPGMHVERKGSGVALHFREAPSRADDVREAAETLATEFGLEIRPGRMVVELVTPGPGKGEAILLLMSDHGLDRALVAGDDWGDLDAFRKLRQAGMDVVVVAVVSEEAPPGLAEDADLVLTNPDEFVSFLQELAARG